CDEFLAVAAHDLKNPLAVISGRAQLLRRQVTRLDTPATEKLLDGIGRIEATTNQMVTLINELLDVARRQLGHPREQRLDVHNRREPDEIDATIALQGARISSRRQRREDDRPPDDRPPSDVPPAMGS
ncbi:MAG: histidine kinase dimerization/phospho-acceptor domain-containing protein, partial [Chloroflexota bacterium]